MKSLACHPRNVRKHPEANLVAICNSLQEFGQQKPIVVWHDLVICGNGTFTAALRLEWDTINIVRMPDSTPEDRVEAYAIADNKTTDMSEFDFELLANTMKDLQSKNIDLSLTGFQGFELAPLLDATWNPSSDTPPESDTEGNMLKFDSEQWEIIQSAITKLRTQETQYDTSTDRAALVVLCYLFLNQ